VAMKSAKFTVGPTQHGQRLDAAAQLADIGLSRRKAKAVIDLGGAYVNRKRVRRAAHVVKTGDRVEFQYLEQALKNQPTEAMELEPSALISDQKDFVILNKPPGLPSQATRDQAVFHVIPLLEKLMAKLGRAKGRWILVHRLDKETSGLLIVAKSGKSATELTDLFRHKTVRKEYWALCYGLPTWRDITLENHLSEIDKNSGLVREVFSGGRLARTNFKVLANFPNQEMSLIACYPETGRSHQIRVHLASLRLPILGDKKYGDHPNQKKIPEEILALASQHHFLHARKLEFSIGEHPEKVSFEAPLPPNIVRSLKILGYTPGPTV
jgi:RluA family pseudouridine synthase